MNYRTFYYGCPDDDAFRFMASIYSHSHYNMSSSKEFLDGITNGAAWYDYLKVMHKVHYWSHCSFSMFIITKDINAGTLYTEECKIGTIYMLAVSN